MAALISDVTGIDFGGLIADIFGTNEPSNLEGPEKSDQ